MPRAEVKQGECLWNDGRKSVFPYGGQERLRWGILAQSSELNGEMRHLKKTEEESSKQRRQQVQRLQSGSILSFFQGHQCGKVRMSEGRVEDWDALDFVGLESVWKDTLLRKNNLKYVYKIR